MKRNPEGVTQAMEFDEAVTYFEKLKQIPNETEPHLPYVNLGRVYLMKGMLRKAREEFVEAQKFDADIEEIQLLIDSVDISMH